MTTFESDEREWLEPDGLGGFAMGTVSGVRTRRLSPLFIIAHASVILHDHGLGNTRQT